MSDTKPQSVTRRRRFLTGAGALSLTGLAAVQGARGGVRPATPQRRQATNSGQALKGGSDNTLVPPFEVRVLNKMGFGPARRTRGNVSGSNPDVIMATGFEALSSDFAGQDDIAHFLALGSNDNERLANYVEEQLDPNLDDSDFDQRFAQYASQYTTLQNGLGFVFSNRECNGFSQYSRPYFEVEMAAFMRAVYSRRQLFELIADFWHNHLNIFGGGDEDIYVSWASWDRDVIRRYAFGNFYQMLYASARHPAMLRYLDNYVNSAGGINENYPRELFELHTMGAINYRSLDNPIDVEPLPNNPYTAVNDPDLNNPAFGYIANPVRQIARYYVDDDVYSAAESLTGWRYNDENTQTSCGTGAFFTDEGAHSGNIAKAVLTKGLALIPSDLAAEDEGRLIIKMAAYHPGTAEYIGLKLCQRLIADNPPQSIVDAAAQTFFDNRISGKQIERTLRTILLSDEFKDSSHWGAKTKRPFEYVVSAMRAAGCQHDFRPDDDDSSSFMSRYRDAGQRLFWWRTPDGYPDFRDHWQGSTSLVHCWRTIDWLVDRNALDPDRFMRIISITLENLAGDPTPRRLVEFWCNWILGFAPAGGWVGPPGTLYQNAQTVLGGACLQFMTQQGFSGNNDASVWPGDEPIPRDELRQDSSPEYWNRRLRGLVDLIVWSPQFMQR